MKTKIKINVELLERFYDWLLTERKMEFYFGTFLRYYKNNGQPKECGTLACLMGNLPAFDPEHWEWSRTGLPILKNYRGFPAFYGATEYFSISYCQAEHLFLPTGQIYGRPQLPTTASFEEAMDNFRDFIVRVKSGEIQ